MELDRLLEITNDREQCEFCPDPTWCENICTRCNKVKPITAEELREYYREIRKVITENAVLKTETNKLYLEAEAAVNDMERMAVFSTDPCEICSGPGECEMCHFQWRGVEE